MPRLRNGVLAFIKGVVQNEKHVQSAQLFQENGCSVKITSYVYDEHNLKAPLNELLKDFDKLVQWKSKQI